MISRRYVIVVAVMSLPFVLGVSLPRCDLNQADFVRISENGFDAADNEIDWNDYPNSIQYFVPDGEQKGYLYVGTGNGINELMASALGLLGEDSGERPPEIRRYRPDQSRTTWEKVFDYRDFEDGPDFTSTAFRNMSQYRSKSDGVNRLYASTFGAVPTMWRTPTGEPGSWEAFYSTDERGSIRWMTEHQGLLYIAIANDITADGSILETPGRILATDGDTVWPVMEDGFGNAANGAIESLISYNGWLWAGTANNESGFEIWKLAGPNGEGPVKVVANGGTNRFNSAAVTPYEFKGDLYWGSLVFMGIYVKGCVLLRIKPDDSWETIVGPGGLSGYSEGFNNDHNAYLWSLGEHDGWLYAGTTDFRSVQQAALDTIRQFRPAPIRRIIDAGGDDSDNADLGSGIVGALTQGGGDLWKSQDGVHWTPVFKNGLGNSYNFGVRQILSLNGKLYLGLANPWQGFEMWRGSKDAADQQ